MDNNANNISLLGKFEKRKKPSNPSNLATFLQSEIQLQATCYQWLWNNYPQTRRCMAHVPNGGSRNKVEAAQLKAAGVLAGVHDLFFYWKKQLYWFELKVGSNVQSEAQLLFGEAMKAQGAICYEVRTFDQFKEIILEIL